MDRPPAVALPITEPDALWIPWFQSPLFESQLERVEAPEEWKQLARRFRDDGYLVLHDVVPPELIESIAAQYDWLFDPETRFDVSPERARVLTMDPGRRQDAWTVSARIRELACLEPIVALLRFLYRREPIPFQTLSFLRGTEQSVHSDAIHFNSIPAGYMCGVWVAMEQIDEDNGPLVYYPGSHRLPELRLDQLGLLSEDLDGTRDANYERCEAYVRAVIEAGVVGEHIVRAPPGTVVIWSANLLHGGKPIRDPARTRMSQVTHYYFDGCTYLAPINSDSAFGEHRLKSVFDIARDKYVEHTLCGHPLDVARLPNGRHRIARKGDLTYAALLAMLTIKMNRRVDRWMRKLGLRNGGSGEGWDASGLKSDPTRATTRRG